MCARTLIYQVKRLQWRQAFLVYLVVFTVTSGILRAYLERYVNRVGVPELWSSTYQRLGTSSCDKCIPHENEIFIPTLSLYCQLPIHQFKHNPVSLWNPFP